MREIKFRVWDAEKGEFTKGPIILATNGVFIDSEHYDVQQFTGLKDKNGKEIYEGDVISEKNRHGDYPPRVVQWEQAKCRFSSEIGGASFALNPGKDFVIGNIHENPNLINDNK